MKNKLFFALLISMTLFACKGHSDEKEPAVDINKCTQYACPNHQDKTSTTLEKCPACGTLMIAVDSLKMDSLKRAK